MLIVALAVIYNMSLDLGEVEELVLPSPEGGEEVNDERKEPEEIVGEEAIRRAGEALRESLLLRHF